MEKPTLFSTTFANVACSAARLGSVALLLVLPGLASAGYLSQTYLLNQNNTSAFGTATWGTVQVEAFNNNNSYGGALPPGNTLGLDQVRITLKVSNVTGSGSSTGYGPGTPFGADSFGFNPSITLTSANVVSVTNHYAVDFSS